jgi:von Willebrand factor type A domain/Aerotolerance regulator N-terminal
MNFSSPWWLLLLLLVPLVIILHALTFRWRSITASSLLFWNEVLKDRRASLRIRRVLRSLVLLLQCLAVAALALALGGPLLFGPRRSAAQDVVLVLDATASMQAREGARTRWDIARDRGLAFASGLRGGARMAVVLAEKSPRLLSPFTGDRSALRRLLESARATDEPGDVASGMLFAMSLRDPRRGGRVVLETDGAFNELAGVDMSLPWVTVETVGSRQENVGITGMSFRQASEAGGAYQLFLAVLNAGRTTVTVPLTIRAADREVVSRTLTVGAGQRNAVTIPWTGPTTGRVTASLGVHDALAVDDTAYADFAPARRLQVLVIGPQPRFIQQALESLPGVAVSAQEAPAEENAQADVVVYVGVQPPPLLEGNFVLFDAVPPNLPVRVTGLLRVPQVTGWSTNDPLLDSVSLAGTAISQAMDLAPGPGFSVLAASGRSPLLLSWDHAGVKALMLAFDPRASDLPLRPGFPILVANALSWFFPDWLEPRADQVQAGDPRVIPTGGAASVTVVKPDGRSVVLPADGPSVTFFETDETGYYTVKARGQDGSTRSARTPYGSTRSARTPYGSTPSSEFAVNLASGSETDITPRFSPPAALPDAGQRTGLPTPVWPAVAAAALVLLLLEWLAWLWRPGRAGTA